MLVSLSGVQGSGKTTVLNGLKALGYNVIERKTARSVLSDWNVTLEQVYANQELCKKFHDELLVRKLKDELQFYTSNDLVFTERSYADLFTYALVSLGHFNTYSEWLNKYYDDCKDANAKYLAVFFLTAPNDRTIEHDGVRGTNQHYVHQIDDNVRRASRSMSTMQDGTFRYYNPLIEVAYDQIDQRVRFVASESVSLWLTKRLHVDSGYQMTMEHPVRIEQQKTYSQFMATSKASLHI